MKGAAGFLFLGADDTDATVKVLLSNADSAVVACTSVFRVIFSIFLLSKYASLALKFSRFLVLSEARIDQYSSELNASICISRSTISFNDTD